ncbi:hypothetical protein MTR_3g464520 [Medicago truncatula]|uniref:Uncharacterized protein n=1 Tax=Medicago truncatula TaxID=3880 RepID=A0A072V813_MEDTR|nr:hypothetical protein MTR_3g464520 [Medicago truncatula]
MRTTHLMKNFLSRPFIQRVYRDLNINILMISIEVVEYLLGTIIKSDESMWDPFKTSNVRVSIVNALTTLKFLTFRVCSFSLFHFPYRHTPLFQGKATPFNTTLLCTGSSSSSSSRYGFHFSERYCSGITFVL